MTDNSRADKSWWNRRRFLATVGTGTGVLLAGCSGDGGTDDDNDDSPGNGDDTPTDREPGNGGDGNGDGDDGDDGDSTEGVYARGETIDGEYASFVVEYARPVETVYELRSFPRTTDDQQYGVPRTVAYYQNIGLAKPNTSFYAVGIAVKNGHDKLIDASTVFVRNGDSAEIGLFPKSSQKLNAMTSGRGTGRPLVPGEIVRGETVFALPDDPSNYTLTFQLYVPETFRSEKFDIDLGRGADTTASFTQNPAVQAYDQPVAVGDFDVTLNAVERVSSVVESPHQEIFGPRPGYEYLYVDLSATRTSNVMVGQDWSIAASDDQGHSFSWTRIYQDAIDLNRTRLEELDVGQSINHRMAFPIDEEFEPTYLGFNGPGPLDSDDDSGARKVLQRVLWPMS